MAQIPFPDGYKPKKRLGKQKSKVKKDKDRHGCPEPKSENEPIKTNNNSEKTNSTFPSIEDPRAKSFMEQIGFPDLTGGIEWPTEFDKFICEDPSTSTSEELTISRVARLARASAYIAMYLQRCIEENPKKEHVVEDWYRITNRPFTSRIKPMKPICEDILDVLPGILSNFEQRFREMYGRILSVAKKADEDKAHTLGAGINNFKLASIGLYDTIFEIRSEAFIMLEQLTKPASGGKGDLPNEKLTETEQDTTPAKNGRIAAGIWKLYEITLKVIIDAVLKMLRQA